jgi:hypothetical protein
MFDSPIVVAFLSAKFDSVQLPLYIIAALPVPNRLSIVL